MHTQCLARLVGSGGDGDFSGELKLKRRDTDTHGVYIASEEDFGGDLYIVDGDNQIKINNSWLEYQYIWDYGSDYSKAIAVSDLNSSNEYFLAIYEDKLKVVFKDETTSNKIKHHLDSGNIKEEMERLYKRSRTERSY